MQGPGPQDILRVWHGPGPARHLSNARVFHGRSAVREQPSACVFLRLTASVACPLMTIRYALVPPLCLGFRPSFRRPIRDRRRLSRAHLAPAGREEAARGHVSLWGEGGMGNAVSAGCRQRVHDKLLTADGEVGGRWSGSCGGQRGKSLPRTERGGGRLRA